MELESKKQRETTRIDILIVEKRVKYSKMDKQINILIDR